MSFGVAVAFLFAPLAAEAPFDQDPQLETIFVTAPAREPLGPISETHHSLNEARIESFGAASSAEIVRRLPSAQIGANSRGETLVNLRSAGERQVMVFFDGAPLNTPWDNRLDLDVIPSSVVRRAVSSVGPLSPQYGVNALGAIALFPHEWAPGDPSLEATFKGGTGGQYGGDARVGAAAGEWSFLGAGGYYHRDGLPLSGKAALPYSQDDGDLRTNTDLRRVNGLARVSRALDAGEINMTVLFSDVESGVAPEGHLEEDARFWRYPDTQMMQGILGGVYDLSPAQEVTVSVWAQRYSQAIDSYEGAGYALVDEREEGVDTTFGARGIWRGGWGKMLYTVSASAAEAKHEQIIFGFEDGAPPDMAPPEEIFSQRTASIGAEAERYFTEKFSGQISVGLDYVDYVKTGGRPGAPDYKEPVARAALAYQVTESLRFRAAAGRRSRMPTMRELFSTALDRFLINPDLKAETISTLEAGADFSKDGWRLSAIAFAQDVKDTIDQRRVDGLRQRVNLEGSRVVGIELAGAAELGEVWTVSGALTAARIRRKTAPGEATDHIAERPAVLANLSVRRRFSSGASLGAEIEYRGRAYSPDEAGFFVPLETSTQLNLSASLPVGRSAELYLNADNITDALVEPQIGLPGPGRTLRGGIRIALP